MPAGLCANAGREARRRRATRPAPLSPRRFIVSSRVGVSETWPKSRPERLPCQVRCPLPRRLAMQTAHPDRIRLGALGLGLSALLLTVFPLARPFFRLDIFAPEETLVAASPAFTSVPWALSHYLAMLGF